MPDGRRTCIRHASAEHRALVDELDRHAAGIGLRRDGGGRDVWDRWCWPYGPNIDVPARQRLVEWAEEHELRLSRNAHHCLTWLSTGRCSGGCDDELAYASVPPPAQLEPDTARAFMEGRPPPVLSQPWSHRGAWCDHLTAWTQDGYPAVLVAQPYAFEEHDRREVDTLAARSGGRVRAEVTRGGWYGHDTYFVGLWALPLAGVAG